MTVTAGGTLIERLAPYTMKGAWKIQPGSPRWGAYTESARLWVEGLRR